MQTFDNPLATERRGVFRTPTLSGSSLALLFWWQSLTPSLIPRSWPMQTAVGAICLAIGYAIGTLAGHGLHRLLEHRKHLPGDVTRRLGGMLLAVAWLVAIALGAMLWLGWQNDQRRFMGMPSLGWLDALLMSALSPVVGAFVLIVARLIARRVAASQRFVERYVPSIVVVPATALIIIAIGVALVRGAALPALTAAATGIHGTWNEGTTEGIASPRSASVSGSPASFVAWSSLGRMGRDFVATATGAEDLAKFHGADAKVADPVRVYVGVRSADSLQRRAELAVRELERAGGFARKVLVVWAPTGTGWMIPKAVVALEQLHRGDTAIVAIQYSFFPSILAVFMDAGLANEAGTTLFNAVHARWSKLPADRRPTLVLFGKSLGTSGVEAPFVGPNASSSVTQMSTRTDGALLVGAKESNTIHSQLTRGRDPGSPFWQPIFDRGRTVRFLNRDPNQPPLDAAWSFPRIVYLQHPADPVAFWNVEAFWWPPEWLARPRGFDVPDHMHWFPIVSGIQAVADLLDQLGPPPGFGHDYSTEYVKGWASVVPPEGWTDADTQRLERFIDAIGGDDKER